MGEVTIKPLFITVLGACFTALVAAVFAISFAAIIYTGELARFFEQGIALTLAGAAAIGVLGAFTLSYRGMILGPQDVPAVLLSGAAAGIVVRGQMPPDAVFPTIACLVAAASICTGLAGFVMGRMRLAYVARYFPYPVLAGFLVTTGLLLFLGGIDVAMASVVTETWDGYLSYEARLRWMPVLAASGLMLIATRVLRGSFVMPLILITALVGFYLFYAAIGLSLPQLAESGLLLGPFESGQFAAALDPSLPLRAEWATIFQHVPLILTVAASSLIGATLNASGLELALGRDLDIDKEIKGTGIANIVSGIFGGVPGYHVIGETLLARRLGLTGALAGVSAAAGCLLLLFFGASLLTVLPVGFFATVIAFLGLDLLFSWLWEKRRQIEFIDLGIVLLIPLIAVSFGFLTAIALGLMVACVRFVIDYGKLDPIRFQSDLATRRSLLERPDTDLDILAETGGTTQIVELSTFLFFGSSYTLRMRVQDILTNDPALRWLIMDFRQVHGIDVSTRNVLRRINADCRNHGAALVLTGLKRKTTADLMENSDGMRFYPALETALEAIEDVLIAEAENAPPSRPAILQQVRELFADADLQVFTENLDLDAGISVIDETESSQDIFFLCAGKLRILTSYGTPQEKTRAYVLPGAFVGEMAFYSGQDRTATIVTDAASSLLRIDMSRMAELEAKRPDVALVFHKLLAQSMARLLTRKMT